MMPTHAEVPDGATPRLPVLFIVDADDEGRGTTELELTRRFGADYRVVAAGSAEAGLEVLARLAHQGDEVALVAADLRLPGTDGVEVLKRAHALHSRASRALLVAMDRRGTRIPFDDLASLQRATALGRIDFWMLKGSASPEELIYPHVQEALTAWTMANRTRHEVMRVVGEQWSPRSHDLRNTLARNTVPFGFYAVDSDQGRRLLHEHNVDTDRLPAVILRSRMAARCCTISSICAGLPLTGCRSSTEHPFTQR